MYNDIARKYKVLQLLSSIAYSIPAAVLIIIILKKDSYKNIPVKFETKLFELTKNNQLLVGWGMVLCLLFVGYLVGVGSPNADIFGGSAHE